MNSFPFFQQRSQMDCGPACIFMVQQYYGGRHLYSKIYEHAQLGKDGATLYGLSETAEQLGLKTLSVNITFEKLIKEAPLPAIIHWDQNHFIVVTPQSTVNKIVVADPAYGRLTYTRAEFEQKWIQGDGNTGIALLLETTPALKMQKGNTGEQQNRPIGWKFVLKYLNPYRRYMVQLVLGLVIGTLLQVVAPFLTQSIVDVGIQTRNVHYVQIILLAQLFLFAGRTITEFIRGHLLLFISTRINLSILSDFWIKLMSLPIAYFDTKRTGDTLQRIGDHHRLQNFITASSLNTLFSMVSLLVFSIVLLSFSGSVFTVFAIGSMLYVAFISLFLRRRKKLDVLRFGLAGRENTATMQLVQGMQEIKLNQCERSKRWEWERLQTGLFRLQFKLLFLGQYQQAGAFFINEGKNILITFFTATAVIRGELSLGAMLAIQYIVGQLNNPVEQVIGFIQQAQDARLSLERIGEIHTLEGENMGKTTGSLRMLQNIGDTSIVLRQVSFTYPGAGNEPVLNEINLRISAGKVTAIVGMSGSGKTTLLRLLLQYYPKYRGNITLQSGGVNSEQSFTQVNPNEWRSCCAAVLQDGYIFNDTIQGNITLADEMPNHSNLHEACRIANIIEFVESLPLGFQTKIGAEGNGISQGQRQRILIARAVYRNPHFLFFDEATNALDANNERAILQNLEKFFEGRTVVVVAHRLSTVVNADHIVVLHQGKIVEEGTHFELTAIRGQYYELIKNQLELGK